MHFEADSVKFAESKKRNLLLYSSWYDGFLMFVAVNPSLQTIALLQMI